MSNVKFVLVEGQWINPAYVIRVYESTWSLSTEKPGRTGIEMADGDLIVVTMPAAEVVSLLVGAAS